ncbi:MAG: cation diffusion facilitator family transporter [Actinomycetales bacterium]
MTSGKDTRSGPHAEASADAGDSMLTVLIALAANALVAVAKTVVAVITGSASMVAEAAHSWADTGNEVFLYIAEKRSARPADDTHPFGYGREAYVWSMFAAIGLFAAGSLVSIWHGISQLGAHEPDTDYGWAYLVLGISFVLEAISFTRAVRQAKGQASRFGLRPLSFIVKTSNPTLRAVFVEDAAALVGLVVAAAGIGLHQLTGNATWDAIGSIVVGLLLGVLAIFLIDRNREFLTGQVVDPALRQRALRSLLAEPGIEAVSFLYLEFVGPGKVLLIAAVDLVGDEPESGVARRLQQIEDDLNQRDEVERAILSLSAPGHEGL